MAQAAASDHEQKLDASIELHEKITSATRLVMDSRIVIGTFRVEPVERTIIGVLKYAKNDLTSFILDKSDVPFGCANEFLESVYFHTTLGEWRIKTRRADGSEASHEATVTFI